jgi:hypothetical protein
MALFVCHALPQDKTIYRKERDGELDWWEGGKNVDIYNLKKNLNKIIFG